MLAAIWRFAGANVGQAISVEQTNSSNESAGGWHLHFVLVNKVVIDRVPT